MAFGLVSRLLFIRCEYICQEQKCFINFDLDLLIPFLKSLYSSAFRIYANKKGKRFLAFQEAWS